MKKVKKSSLLIKVFQDRWLTNSNFSVQNYICLFNHVLLSFMLECRFVSVYIKLHKRLPKKYLAKQAFSFFNLQILSLCERFVLVEEIIWFFLAFFKEDTCFKWSFSVTVLQQKILSKKKSFYGFFCFSTFSLCARNNHNNGADFILFLHSLALFLNY